MTRNLSIPIARIIASGLLTGLVGCFVAIAMIMANCDISFMSCITLDDRMLWIVSAGSGAGLSGVLFYKWFGLPERTGWLLACQGAGWAAVVGAMLCISILMVLIGGELFEAGYSAFMAPWFILMVFLVEPQIFIMWAALMVGVHLLLRLLFKYS